MNIYRAHMFTYVHIFYMKFEVRIYTAWRKFENVEITKNIWNICQFVQQTSKYLARR